MQNYFSAVSPPYLAADFHYFRLPPEKWELALTRLAQMGVTMVTMTVPWGFHESVQGKIDFIGATNTRRNVIGVLDLCAAFKLHCILQPGPYSPDNGILNNGLPAWLPPAATNPIPETAIESWLNGLSKALVKYQWPDGPIVCLHINNAGQDAGPTYSAEITEVRWPIWLRKHYQGIDALNAAYATTYRSVSDVPFPQQWSDNPGPLENDAKTFLAEMAVDTRPNHLKILAEAGWQIPIYPFMLDTEPDLPALQNHALATTAVLPGPTPDNAILNLQHPIRVDPDATDIGRGPVWAAGAPIRADGSLRRKFWHIRSQLWAQRFKLKADAQPLTLDFDDGGLVTSAQDELLKIPMPKGTKPTIFRLGINGSVSPAEALKIARSRLSGPYSLDDETGQTDGIIYLNDADAPLNEFLQTYLRMLLTGQVQTLSRCAAQAKTLSQHLSPAPAQAKAKAPASQKPTSYTLAEARRGLQQADNALRKALASIGGLEAGFETMLGKSSSVAPEPVTPALAISPDIFEGRARDIVLEAGQVCRDIIPNLEAAAKAVRQTVDAPALTLEQYRHSHTQAVEAAQSTYQALLQTIAELRIEIMAEQLPLVVWRVHNQLQNIADSLRWGVLRGNLL